MTRETLLAEFDGSVCPACHHKAHDPGSCHECPRCELHTDEAAAFVLRIEPELVDCSDLARGIMAAVQLKLLGGNTDQTYSPNDVARLVSAAIDDQVARFAALGRKP